MQGSEGISSLVGAYAFILFVSMLRTQIYKEFVLPFLIIGFFTLNFFLKIFFYENYNAFFMTHTTVIATIIVVSEIFYRKRKEKYSIKANGVPIIFGLSFILFSIIHRFADHQTYVHFHALFNISLMTFLAFAPYFINNKRWHWLRQFIF